MAPDFKILSMSGEGRGLGIFDSSKYKIHEREPMAQLFWKMRWNVVVWFLCFFGLGFAFAAEHICRYGWLPATQKWLEFWFSNMLYSGGLSIVAEIPYWIGRVVLRTDIMTIAPVIPFILFHMLRNENLEKELNPRGTDIWAKHSSRVAVEADIKKMGLFDGFMMVLGYFNKKPLKFNRTYPYCCGFRKRYYWSGFNRNW